MANHTAVTIDGVETALDVKKRKQQLNVLHNESILVRILQGKTCTPLSLSDFRTYLEKKEFSEENLDVLEWFISYRHRFMALPESERALSPAPVFSAENEADTAHTGDNLVKALFSTSQNGVGVGAAPLKSSILTADGPPTGATASAEWLPFGCPPPEKVVLTCTEDAKRQPFRTEINAAIQLFFTTGASKELNITSAMRKSICDKAASTTHPDVFAPVVKHCLDIMGTSSVPAFMHYAAQNVQTPARISRTVAASLTSLLGVLLVALLIHNNVTRWSRVSAFPLFATAGLLYVAVYSKMCPLRMAARKKEILVTEVDPDAKRGFFKRLKQPSPDKSQLPTRSKVVIQIVEEPLVLSRQAKMTLWICVWAVIAGVVMTAIAVAIPL
ncbi:uncharacterized protein SPPG_05976 [Spizellomyces punctatus DAOM BR117]|uniref:Uncharacterized protein n=1 Tax=Spizellomyces punctatus (strain DAOM BR117) TaxID=645134 RepID=A0A0L0HD12_SPIPD|nr:uncharacterized protein SPPG_05976 [Spizellomyces punctatus DAOM BR117]KNC99027.1 hypothetical protein SPPG_05976 [Spizellomyces punctatus DAOM BR117]|eukprot:XP_016607067.1 hypothetical protein SPPG_05976 [Spizellomyces punctatus DAOM BR117]